MKTSFHSFDRVTHMKIVTVAALAVVAVMLVGQSAQLDRIASAVPAATAAQPVLHPTPQPIWREVPARSPLLPAA